MGLSNDEVNAILRLRDDLQRAIGANQGSITAALMAADQVRDIVNLPALRQMQEMHGRDLLYLRELGDASSRIESQFGIAHAKALADAFVGLKVFDSEQFSPDISAGIAEQLKLLNSTVDHLAGLKALMPPDHLSATIANSLLGNDAALDALRHAASLFKSCEIPDYARELRQLTAMSHESEKLLQTLSSQHGFADLLGVHAVTRSLVRYETGRLSRAYAGFGASIASRPEWLSTQPVSLLDAPADAVFSQSRFVRVVTTHNDIADESALDEIWGGVKDRTRGYIDEVLPELSPELMKAWRGVWDAVHRRGPDWARQAGASLRFILVGVLDAVAPVDALTDIPRQYVHKGKLGRPAQVYWLCVPLQNPTYRRVARADLESAISIIDAMSEAVHRHDYVEIEDAFDTLVVRAAIALCNLLKLWRARN